MKLKLKHKNEISYLISIQIFYHRLYRNGRMIYIGFHEKYPFSIFFFSRRNQFLINSIFSYYCWFLDCSVVKLELWHMVKLAEYWMNCIQLWKLIKYFFSFYYALSTFYFFLLMSSFAQSFFSWEMIEKNSLEMGNR